jgi:hypothetical protein
MKDDIPYGERITAITILLLCIPLLFYDISHQVLMTGFFTETFGFLEMVFLYGSLLFWILQSTLLLVNRKGISRKLESYGGALFVAISIAWFLIVFPFEFSLFSILLPSFLQLLFVWLTNESARILLVAGIIVHLFIVFYSALMRYVVHKRQQT